MKIHCKYDELIEVQSLKPHPKNRNSHPKEQIKRLAQILEYQGFRYPIKVSRASGFVTSGHGRIEAAKLNGWTQVPVNYQEYESEEQEYADLIADNSIASWSELDLSEINVDIVGLGPDFNIDLLGIENFEIEPADKAEIDPDVEFSKEIDEKNDYIVLLFNDKQEFKQACEKLEIKRIKQQLSPNNSNSSFCVSGVGRIIDGKPIIDRLG